MQNIITGTGSYIPTLIKRNKDFLEYEFYTEKQQKLPNSNEIIIKKFKAITGIEERRYVEKDLKNSDIATFAAQKAIEKANINPEELDYIILAQNFGDVRHGFTQCDMLPSIAARVKHNLKIKNNNCVAYDVVFGCPGWIQGVIQADAFIKAGLAKKCLIIGAETLSRVVDPFDRDSMIYSDGAGACILEANEGQERGIISFASQSFTLEEAYFLFYGSSYNPNETQTTNYIKMHGRKIYEFALTNVPIAMKTALDKSTINISQIKKILIHQANEKMDEAIIQRFYELYNMEAPEGIMPMSIHKLGNSSVATVPTLFDLILNDKIENHKINAGDYILLASVGAGMNINAIVYQY
ncbi:ketoacyl-ACP synthase III [Putridiphycobacter roseus]|uniref:Ketoacyl-ACP synthase III n=1 Tax=Putridiphycobacter roseus TaxID=2219161 RepID=A0A2W1NAU4_9FLAO|nr:3-oxoacyl-ACP synthase III family protein [Putridiphycobacter roseus]PZE16385.1 ketoacyl-ACP synthase III [Putridiphycobacter roseus]